MMTAVRQLEAATSFRISLRDFLERSKPLSCQSFKVEYAQDSFTYTLALERTIEREGEREGEAKIGLP